VASHCVVEEVENRGDRARHPEDRTRRERLSVPVDSLCSGDGPPSEPLRADSAGWMSLSVAGFGRFAFDVGSDKRTWLGSHTFLEG
jgi:hypothetical protein